jgi:tRNA pseudouridine55 synthase
LNGVLVIDKPKGWTSHDVVARVRGALKVRKAGHGGTLDPLATGVLPVYLNEATKLVPFNLDGTKEYVAHIRLGQETDTLDADGKIIAERQIPAFARREIEETLKRFRGVIRQKPPLFSAIKKNGVPVYRKARAGETVVLPEREAVIFSLELQSVTLPYATVAVACGRGTYIRSLVADIGQALGCGAHITELRRLRSGLFTLDQSLSIEDFADFVKKGTIKERLLLMKDCVDLIARVQVTPKTAENIKQGKPIRIQDLSVEDWGRLKKGQRVGLCEDPQRLLAIAESPIDVGPGIPPEPRTLRILRVFHQQEKPKGF